MSLLVQCSGRFGKTGRLAFNPQLEVKHQLNRVPKKSISWAFGLSCWRQWYCNCLYETQVDSYPATDQVQRLNAYMHKCSYFCALNCSSATCNFQYSNVKKHISIAGHQHASSLADVHIHGHCTGSTSLFAVELLIILLDHNLKLLTRDWGVQTSRLRYHSL